MFAWRFHQFAQRGKIQFGKARPILLGDRTVAASQAIMAIHNDQLVEEERTLSLDAVAQEVFEVGQRIASTGCLTSSLELAAFPINPLGGGESQAIESRIHRPIHGAISFS